jgi:hypothetical protein
MREYPDKPSLPEIKSTYKRLLIAELDDFPLHAKIEEFVKS